MSEANKKTPVSVAGDLASTKRPRNTTMLIRDPPRLLSFKKRQALMQLCLTRWHDQNPNPSCELYFTSPFQLLVSVVLSAQTTDKMVNRVMTPLYNKGFSPRTVVDMGQTKLFNYIKQIGLARTKSKNVLALATIIIEQHSGDIPSSRPALEALPGVGRKTASVVLGELGLEPTIAVDTHVFRVARRLGMHREKQPSKCEQELLRLIPETYLPKAHHWFILHGRYTCKSTKPACEVCLLADLCPARTAVTQSAK